MPPPVGPMAPLVVSLGATCQCTYQVRRFTGIERASYFDWLGTTHPALLTALRLRLKGLFQRENLVLAREGMTVMDTLTGISYRHAFRWQRGSKLIDAASIEGDYAEQHEKYSFLTERWTQDLQSCSVLFVRHDCPAPKEARELAQALAPFCGKTFRLLFVTEDPGCAERLQGADPAVRSTVLGPPATSESGWQGSNVAWDKVLSGYAYPGAASLLRPAYARDLTPRELHAAAATAPR